MKPLRFLPDARYSCHQTGRCCRAPWLVAVDAEDRARVAAADPARWVPGPHFVTARDPSSGAPVHQFARRAGACVFLDDRQQCVLHEPLGLAGKPLVCRSFPYQFHEGADAIFVGLSFACPSVAGGRGALPGEQAEDLRGLYAAQRRRAGPRPDERRSLAGDEDLLNEAQLETLEDVLRACFEEPPDADPAAGAWRAVRLLRELDDFELAPLAPAEFRDELRRALAVARADRERTDVAAVPLGRAERAELAGWWNLLLNPPSAAAACGRPARRGWARAAQVARGLCAWTGRVRVRARDWRLSLEAARAVRLDARARERLRAFVRMKLFARQYRVAAGVPVLWAFNLLLLVAALAAFTARNLAAAAGRGTATGDDLAEALTALDATYAHARGLAAAARLPVLRTNFALKALLVALAEG